VDLQISIPKPSCVTGKHVLDDLLVYYEMSYYLKIPLQHPLSVPNEETTSKFTLPQKSDTEICSPHIFCVLLIP
jgi:hypothetical protein